ncbi:MAG: alpha-galactosidase [Limnochordales bacterium]|nr:alpha-galactosidase [Limnochordales bacterium]
MEDAVVYQIFVRAFSPEGTLQGVTDRLEYIASLGVNTIYLMPIHPIGEVRRIGTLGSPYSIRDHLEIDPALGTLADLKELVRRAHALGLRVLLDLVPNHTSFDNPLIVQHPDWYVRDASGNPLPPNKEWRDVAQLNYANPELRRYMIDVAAYWLQETGIDGFRVDAPVYVPLDFWREFAAEIKARFPQAFLLAESGESWLMEAFDAQYDWNFLTMITNVLQKGSNPELILAEIDYWRDSEGKLIPKLRYLENHDHDRFLGHFSAEELVPAACALFTLPGIPMIYAGQEIGATVRPSLFDPFKVDWSTRNESILQLYRQLINLRQSSAALRRGELVPITISQAEGVLAFGRILGDETILVLANFRPHVRQGALSLANLWERYKHPESSRDSMAIEVVPLWTSWGEAGAERAAPGATASLAETAAGSDFTGADLTAADLEGEAGAGEAGLLNFVLPPYGAAVYRLVPGA